MLEDNPKPELSYYENDVYKVLSKYFPCFSEISPLGMWAGQYAINSYDNTPIVSELPGMVYVGGASGSGIMKSDSLGRIVATVHNGEKKSQLFNGTMFKVKDLSIHERNVERERFII